MDTKLLEQLLYEDESATLDFKKEQYKFVKASDDGKSELLKDILGFANGWRRSDAYILIGVEENVGGRSKVVGITDHLNDHSLQQFVNNLTNRPVRFGYEVCPLDGKQIGAIRIEEQPRPIYLKKDFGKLERDKVYVRRGSSTDPTKPARPEEIAEMGMAATPSSQEAEIAVEFANPDRDIILGPRMPWSAELCDMPEMKDIPDLALPRRMHPLEIALDAVEGITGDVLNEHYYRELADYEFFKRLFRRVRIVVTNKGKVVADNVRIEMTIPKGEKIAIPDWSWVPDPPKKKRSRFEPIESSLKNIRSAFRHAGDVCIDADDDQFRLEMECKDLQPGRKIWSGDFYIGIGESGEFTLHGHSYAANLSEPKAFTLTIDADITKRSMAVDQLIDLAESIDEDADSDDEE